MVEKVKTNKEMTELEAMAKCPELSDFILRRKIKDVKKTALILAIVAVVVSFVGGLILGSNWTLKSIPNNVVQIQVGATAEAETPEGK